MGWFGLAVLAFTGFGVQNYLYKYCAVRALNSRAVTFIYIIISTAALWVVVTLRPGEMHFTWTIFILAAIDALCYYVTTISRMQALRYLPASVAFPIARLSTLLVVLCAIFFFGEDFTWQLGLALVLVFVVIYFIQSEQKSDRASWPQYGLGVALSILALVSSAGTNLMSKLAAVNGDLSLYMVLANSFIIVLSGAEIRWTGHAVRTHVNRELVLVAVLLAASNLTAWYSYLYALIDGPLGVVSTIAGLAFIPPIVLSAMFHEERLSFRRSIALVLTGLALTLLHFS